MTKKTTKKAKTKKAAAAPKSAAAKTELTPAAIGARAHEIWIAKGKPIPGTPVEDWLQAERELGARKA
jgi:hypothetical protein